MFINCLLVENYFLSIVACSSSVLRLMVKPFARACSANDDMFSKVLLTSTVETAPVRFAFF